MNTPERTTLNFPIEHDGLPIKEIALRRPTVGDHLAAQKSAGTDAEREIRLIANLAELPPAAIHQLDMKGWQRFGRRLGCSAPSNHAGATDLKSVARWPRDTPPCLRAWPQPAPARPVRHLRPDRPSDSPA